MSTLTYNGVDLSLIKTQTVDEFMEYTPDGVDYLYTRYTINLQSTVFVGLGLGNANPTIGGRFALGETPTDAVQALQHALEVPRRELLLEVGGKTLIKSGPGIDVKGGPFPKVNRIEKIHGSDAYIVFWSCETYLLSCDRGRRPFPDILSNRWTQEVTIDEDWYTRRTHTGKLVIRHRKGVNADQFREVRAAPHIEHGFKRISADYKLQSDGLALMYTIVDQEVYRLPPDIATDAEGEFVEHSRDGVKRFGKARVNLRGSKRADKSGLMQAAIIICYQKLCRHGLFHDPATGVPLLYCTLQESLWKNSVSVTLEGLLQPHSKPVHKAKQWSKPNKFTSGAIPLIIHNSRKEPDLAEPANAARKLGGVPVRVDLDDWNYVPLASGEQYDIGHWPVDERGLAKLPLVIAGFNDPCLVQAFNESQTVVLNRQDRSNIFDPPNNPPPPPPSPASLSNEGRVQSVAARLEVLPSLPDDMPRAGDMQLLDGGIYTDYLVNMRYRTDRFKLHLPAMKEGVAAASVAYAEPAMKLIVEFVASRLGQPPKLPPEDLGDDNVDLAWTEVDPGTVQMGADGVMPQFEVCGRYEYNVKDRSLVNVAAALPPWTIAMLDNQAASSVVADGQDETQLNPTLRSAAGLVADNTDLRITGALTEGTASPQTPGSMPNA